MYSFSPFVAYWLTCLIGGLSMLLLYHKLNEFATFLFIFFIAHQPLTQITKRQKRRKIILKFLARRPPKNGHPANPLSEPIGRHSLKVSTKNYRGRVENKRDERANDYMSSYKGALVGNIPNNILNAKKASINEFFKA